MPRKKPNKTQLEIRVLPETPERLKKLAEKHGFIYANKGATGAFLDALATNPNLLQPEKPKNP